MPVPEVLAACAKGKSGGAGIWKEMIGNGRLWFMRSLVLFVLTGVMLWGQNAGGRGTRPGTTPSAVARLIETLREATSPDQAVRDVHTIWGNGSLVYVPEIRGDG